MVASSSGETKEVKKDGKRSRRSSRNGLGLALRLRPRLRTGQGAGCFKRRARLELALCTIAGGSRGRGTRAVSPCYLFAGSAVEWTGGVVQFHCQDLTESPFFHFRHQMDMRGNVMMKREQGILIDPPET
jgi:hypothetical protein